MTAFTFGATTKMTEPTKVYQQLPTAFHAKKEI